MSIEQTPELFWLTALTLMTASLWIPHVLSLVYENGLITAVGDGEHDVLDPTAEVRLSAAWARRAQRAHWNAIENLVVFAPSAAAIHFQQLGDATTAQLCAAFFFIRAGHFLVYVLGAPYIRTLLFFAGYGVLVTLGLRLLGWT